MGENATAYNNIGLVHGGIGVLVFPQSKKQKKNVLAGQEISVVTSISSMFSRHFTLAAR